MHRIVGAVAVLALLVALVGVAAIDGADAASTRTSAASGRWSDLATWDGGTLPQPGDSVTIAAGHDVVYDQTAPPLAGVTIAAGASLTFAPDQALTLESTANVVVEGTLSMRPAAAAIVQTLRFTGVNPAAFVGGGLDPIASDVGLWVMGAGRLDLSGTPKTSWARATGGIAAGATSVSLDAPATGWMPGDEISIAPTEPPTVGTASWAAFDPATVTAASGTSVSFDRPTARPHPVVNTQWTAEILNLTRNVRLEGTPTGKTHVFIRSTSPQTVNYVGIRNVGPGALGRYGLHFHMAHDGSRGSQVVGTVVRDAGAHAFVAHMSNGVLFKDTISYNTVDDAYWWDQGEPSEDITYDHAVAALVRTEPSFRGFRLSGFSLGRGVHLSIRDSVAVGVQGNVDASGFHWPENSEGIWDFSRGNVAHNNKVDGIFNWQNTSRPHVLSNFVSYYNGEAGVDHGAYNNNYHFEHATLYGNGSEALELRAVSSSAIPLRFDDVVFDGGGITPELVRSFDHNSDGTGNPTVFTNSTFRGSPVAFHFGAGATPDALDVVNSTIETPTDITFDAGAPEANVVRLQPDDTHAQQVTPSGRVDIAPFADFTDTSPPEAAIVSPIGGSIVAGTVPVLTTSYDNVAVTKIELYVDDSLVGTSTAPPFSFSFPATGSPGSALRLALRSYDAAGNVRESAGVIVLLAGTPPSSTTTPSSSTTTTSTTPPSSTTAPSSTTTSSAPPTTAAPPVTTFLSQLTPTSSTNGFGPIERDQSNGGGAANDGRTITLNGKTYAKGLGVHAKSEVRYALNRQYKIFGSDVGIDDECGSAGSVTFEVYLDSVKVFDSGRLTGTSATKPVLVDTTNKNELRLVVTTAGDGNACDHADWAGASLGSAGTAPSTTAPPTTAPPTTAPPTTAPPTTAPPTTAPPTTAPPTTAPPTTAPPTTAPATTAPPTTAAPPVTTFLSQLTPTSATNGFGPIERDQSNGGGAANDGRPITVNGKVYAKGLGVHAKSDVRYALNRQYKSFGSDLGIDDECDPGGSVTFEVYLDGAKVFDSGRLTGTSATKPVLLNTTNKNELRLVVTTAGDGNACDHADWAGASVTR